MIKINEKIETEKQSHNVGVKDASYEAVRALIKDGWEVVVLEPTKHKGYMRREWVVWYARMVKGNHAIYIEVSGHTYGMIDAKYQCPVCGDDCGDNEWCSSCDNEIQPVLLKSIPADFKGGEKDVTAIINR